MGQFRLGIDIGSTTIKVVVIDEVNDILFNEYRRHFSNIEKTLLELIQEVKDNLGNIKVSAMITGSGGLSLASWVGLDFLQEVIAVSEAISVFTPTADVAIEIGGEDAKIIYFDNTIEHRMNGICAGGTGAFIDQMASLLQTDAMGLNELAKDYEIIYPIAARCGVFAKSDIQPLINEGAKKSDLAISIFNAVVTQTITGLACGKPIRGNVVFLGGPLHFLTELTNQFKKVLNLTEESSIVPENSHLFAALGSAVKSNTKNTIDIDTLINNLQSKKVVSNEIGRLQPLFENEDEYNAFVKRHESNNVKRVDLNSYKGDAFIGIDAGSTTTKLALVTDKGELLHSFYASNEGNPIKVITKALNEVYDILPEGVVIRNSCVTGYGEALAQSGFRIDIGEIETIAHYKAAEFFQPDVDFILDIGGQDMKCIRIKNGVVDSVLLNEACSAGCGSFIETFAKSLDMDVSEFADVALYAKNPIDLGSRCTVFMNSNVKQAQKEGAEVADISAGLSFSVIKNALQKVIKITDPSQMGKSIVVQGGTFYNKSVLRAFEIISEREPVCPDISGIMGAFGASIIAKQRYEEGYETTIVGKDELNTLEVTSTFTHCKACSNNCLLTINKFSSGSKFVSGNRCERGLGVAKNNVGLPNLVEYKLHRVFDYTPITKDKARRGKVGIPRVLNMYENYPLWFTFFTELGYEVVLSDKSSRAIYEKGINSMPSESVCYPAKLVHGHIQDLIDKDIKFIFYPSIAYENKRVNEADNNYNCPIVTSYPEVIKNNVEELITENVSFVNPFISLNDKKYLAKRLCETFVSIPNNEIKKALDKAWEENEKVRDDIRQKGEEALEYVKNKNITAVVLSGRPYHIDPEINHGIPELITGYGVAVLTEDSVAHLVKSKEKLNVHDQWAYHSRLYRSANLVATTNNLQLIQLTSFGCGLDAVTADETRDIIESANKIYTLLKIDEVSNLGSARIRVRSLFASLKEQKDRKVHITTEQKVKMKRPVFTKEMKKTHTILCPQMSPIHFDMLEAAITSEGYNFVVMPPMDKTVVETGLKYVNNDACYPATIVVGQLINAVKSGEYDTDNLSIVISHTGGGCRASNYSSFIKRALDNAGYPNIPVIPIGSSSAESENFNLSVSLLNKITQGIVYGDLFMRVVYRTRPYEAEKGSVQELYQKWNKKCKEDLKKGNVATFNKNIANIVNEFDNIKLLKIKKPKVGVVGEILVKFNPVANNDIVTLLEQEGCEAVVPDLLDFFMYALYNNKYKEKYFGFKKASTLKAEMAIQTIELYRSKMRQALTNSKRFTPPVSIQKLGKLAEPIVSLGNQTGEGWFLTAEMVELIESGASNIICTQPFGCLPNHVTGKGVLKEIKKQYSNANIVAIDYDPGASEVNQLNRIKLMLSTAFKNFESEAEVEIHTMDKSSNLSEKSVGVRV